MQKFSLLVPGPDTVVADRLGAFAVNLFCAFLLARYRAHSGSLTRAAFLSARNDAFANIAIIAAGVLTAVTVSPWPDLLVGLVFFAFDLGAAREVLLRPLRSDMPRLPSLEDLLINFLFMTVKELGALVASRINAVLCEGRFRSIC